MGSGFGIHAAPDARLSSAVIRVAARTVDVVAVFVLAAVASAVVGLAGGWAAGVDFVGGREPLNPGSTSAVLFICQFAVPIACAIAYEVLLTTSRSQTLGKFCFGIQVVRAEDGGALGVSRSVRRSLLPALLVVPTVAWLGVVAVAFGLVLLFCHPRHRNLFDMLGGSVVVDAPFVEISVPGFA